ncbi:MAG TPA: hypothetical protein DCM26_04695 [Desulfotomaculum sp.]|jgi:hypothetical protein|nr:hypothetical protein [Desulfotomaculum sp.]
MPEEKVLEVKEQPGAFFYLANRIDGVEQKLSAKIEAVEQKLSAKIEAVEDNLRREFKEEFSKLKTEQMSSRQELKEEIGKLDEKIDTLRYWVIGILVVGFGGVIAAIKL